MNEAVANQLSQKKQVLEDCFFAIKSWRIWCYMGVQDLQNQFRRSRLGAFWGLINLVFMASCIAYVYGHLFQQDISTFFPYLISGIVIWTFLVASFVQSCQAFIVSEGYIKQFSFPKQIYIFRFFITACLNLAMGLSVCLVVVMINSHNPAWYSGLLWMVVGLLVLFVISIGHITIFAYAGAKYRDLGPALGSLSLMLFYITPIVFNTDMLEANHLGFIYQYNPFYYLVEIVRYPLLHGVKADPSIYYAALAYGGLIWTIALFTLLQNDRKVAYWL